MALRFHPVLVLASTLAVACSNGGSDNDTNATGASSSGTTSHQGHESGSSSSGPDGSSSGAVASSTSATGTESSSSSGDAGSTSATTAAETTRSSNACDPVIPGEWNACRDADGNVDNTLCNWTGSGSATGFIGCLSSSQNQDANVCFISGCRDACDCFAPPSTGTAEVVCAAILQDGGMGCALDCGDGRTCPDGMECMNNTCFWPPPA